MAIELTDELLELQRAADEAGRAATAGPYSAGAWLPWRAAAETVQAAVTKHAATNGLNRFELEAALRRVVRHPAG